jgi:tetratricopeptide (TPR) repeat protein
VTLASRQFFVGAIMPNNIPAIVQSQDFFSRRKYFEALQTIETAVATDPSNCELQAELGRILCYYQRENEAVDCLEKAWPAAGSQELAAILANYTNSRKELTQRLDLPDTIGQELWTRIQPFWPASPQFVGTKISAILIVKNEEKHLERCLQSIQGGVDEIIVVDTGSTDKTVEIAESFGAKIGHFEWCNDFSAARNYSLGLATGDWALWIDADEAVSQESWNPIYESVIRPHFGGYFTRIVNFTDENETTEYTHAPIRLFRIDPRIRFTGSIHEQISPAIDALGWPTAHLDKVTIHHYGYKPSEIEAKDKLNRTIDMLQVEIEREPNDSFHWFNLANVYSVAKRYSDSVEAAKKCISLMEPTNAFASLTHQLLSGGLNSVDKAEEAVDIALAAKRAGCFTILNQFELAHSYLLLRKFEDGLVAIEACLNMSWPDDMTGDRGIVTHKSHVLKGQILCELNRLEEAGACIDFALTVDPAFGLSKFAKAIILERQENHSEAENWFKNCLSDTSVAWQSLKGLARISLERENWEDACNFSWAALEARPNDKEAWTSWAKALEGIGDPTKMIESYQAYTDKHGDHADVLTNWGRSLEIQGDYQGAVEKYVLSTEVDPTCSNAWLNLGDLLFKAGSFGEAATSYQNALQIEPVQPDAWFCLGNCCGNLNVWEAAVSAYSQALTIDPSHAGAAHNLEVAKGELAAA